MPSDSIRTFHYASPIKQSAPSMIIFSLVFPVLLYVTQNQNFTPLYRIGIVVMIIVLDGVIYWMISRARIEVSSEGIVYTEGGVVVRSTWDNILGYGTRPRGLFRTQEVLILREPGLELKSRLISNSDRYAHLADMIPVALFANDWRNSELGVLIKQYAPHAFDHHVNM